MERLGSLRMKKYKNIIIIASAVLLVVVVILLINLASTKDSIPSVGKIKNQDVHKAPNAFKNEPKGEALRQQITKDFLEDIQIMQSSNPSDYKKGLTGKALQEFTDAYNQDAQGNKLRIRVYNTLKASVNDMQFNVPEATFKFVDNSYFVNPSTMKPISQPLNVIRTWYIGMHKEDGRWKIALIMGAAKPNTQ